MPHAIPQTHSAFYPHRDATAGHAMKGFLLYGSRLVLAYENIRGTSTSLRHKNQLQNPNTETNPRK